jgi:hypothetical protein
MKAPTLFSLFFLLTTAGFAQTIAEKFPLPTDIQESSCLVFIPEDVLPQKGGLYITINDSGNEPVLYFLSTTGKVIRRVFVTNGNIDWEAITVDSERKHLYIGDIGNNNNKRSDLKVLKLPLKPLWVRDTITAEEILFSYPQQTGFPPPANAQMFDAEALIWFRNRLLIFTKNRNIPFDGLSLVYSLPDAPGQHQAQLLDTLHFPGFRINNWITDASILPNQSRLALLAGGYVYLFLDFDAVSFKSGRFVEIELPISRQFEGITWLDSKTLAISCEASKLGDPAVFHFDISEEIGKHDSIRRAEVILKQTVFNDTLYVALNLEVAGRLYFELFDHSGNRAAFGTGDFYEKGLHELEIPITQTLFNGFYMINIIIGDRPHGFFARRFSESDAKKGREELKKALENK